MTTPLVSILVTVTMAQIIPPDAKVEQVATGFRFTEGPALAPDGSIYFTDIPNERIHRYAPATGDTHAIVEHSGGANGLTFTNQWFYACEGKARQVTRRPIVRNGYGEYKGIGQPEAVASRFEGLRLNSPNDLAADDTGGLWFTDPRYGKRDDLELAGEFVFLIDNQGRVRHIKLPITRPNGITWGHGGLYVADHAQRRILRVHNLEGKTSVFAKHDSPGGPDGLTVDRVGNVYAAWHGGGGVHVWNPGGEHVGFIATPEQPTNCCFGADGTTLYITAGKSLYRVTLEVPAALQPQR